MAVSEKDLFLAILAMDSYNRGSGAGINNAGSADLDGLGDASDGTIQIGTATISYNLSDAGISPQSQAAGFYAVAYDTQYGKVISYRGTDSTPAGDFTNDATRGWPLGGGDYFTPQTALANDFLDAVQTAAPRCCG